MGADFHGDLFFYGLRPDLVSAGTFDYGLDKFRMNPLFHFTPSRKMQRSASCCEPLIAVAKNFLSTHGIQKFLVALRPLHLV